MAKNSSRHSLKLKVLDLGGGTEGRTQRDFYPNAEIRTLDLKTGWDATSDPIPSGYPIIFSNHLLEHLVDPDAFLEKCWSAMVPEETKLILITPNQAAWYNRLLFLLGYVPISVELSTQIPVGHWRPWNTEDPTGHVRVFTVPALKELLDFHGFQVTKVEGQRSTAQCPRLVRWLDGVLTGMKPEYASAFRIEAVRRRDGVS